MWEIIMLKSLGASLYDVKTFPTECFRRHPRNVLYDVKTFPTECFRRHPRNVLYDVKTFPTECFRGNEVSFCYQ